MNQSSITTPDQSLKSRYATAGRMHGLFFVSTMVAIVMLLVLLTTVLDQSMGFVAVVNTIEPSSLASRPLEELDRDTLIAILTSNMTSQRLRTLERDKPFNQRSRDELHKLVIERVVDPQVIASWRLFESILMRDEIENIVSQKDSNAYLEFRSWLNRDFLSRNMSSRPELAGVSAALKGSLMLILIAILFAFPIGIGAAVYLEEYSQERSWIQRVIQTNIDNLAGVPSIVYGILGLSIIVRGLAPITSGAVFGTQQFSGRTILSGGLTLGLLILPVLIINAQEAIRAVPSTLRQASYGLGATRWQTTWHHVIPAALPGILTGSILGISRAIGETAPLIVVGASTFISADPSSIFSSFTALPIQIYNWTSRPQDQFRNIAAAAILVLLISLLSLNAIAILLRNRYSKQD